MSNHDKYIHEWRKELLAHIKGEEIVNSDELSLFEWYARESSKIIGKMLSEEKAFIQQQVNAGADLGDVNDSGMVAVEYYIKRARYADIIYMASLLETYLARACERLIVALGDQNVIFRPEELMGDKWAKRKKFLERYGGFAFPKDVWSNLQTLIRVRNILVHENGSSNSISESDRDQIVSCRGISIDAQEMVIENEYVEDCFSTFRSLVEFIDKQFNHAIDHSLQPQDLKPE